ncbi:glycosyltransferase family 4 protein [Panacibacter sp. DH6]|uniref:Glycosyltransferase family 4 protein n=1 Tax=Panacibacter microcysteis TaxID=2793269 RepID=A0A931E241_9BACT|nr:glycosyltransferase family 4 protein [Panacibacter microcysteis]MBG9377152.1 glycosyltransferase family 4 protein [Panacibacter microcysteis]
MRLIIVVDTFPSLTETFISNKVKRLTAKGVSIAVLCVKHNEKLFAQLFKDNNRVEVVKISKLKALPFIIFKPLLFIKAVLNVKNYKQHIFRQYRLHTIKKLEPDIIHFEFSGIGVDYLYEIENLACKKVVSCRGSAEKVKLLVQEERKGLFRKLVNRVDAVHCVSEDMRRTVLSYCNDESKLFINYPSIDPDFFHAAFAKDRQPDAQRIILSVGRFTFQKGFLTGLQAIAQLQQNAPQLNFKWVLIGTGPDYEQLVYTIHQLGISNVVQLVGSKSAAEVKQLMSEADVYFLPSVYEGVANVALEAMSMELPVLSTRSGGMEEVIQHGFNGLLADVYDYHQMAAALQLLLTDSLAAAQMAAAARQTILSRFTLDIQTGVFLQQYARLLNRPPVDQGTITVDDQHQPAKTVHKQAKDVLRIGIILPSFPVLSETFFLTKVSGLCQRGHEVIVFSSRDSTEVNNLSSYHLDQFSNLTITSLDFNSSFLKLLITCLSQPVTAIRSIHFVPKIIRRRLFENLCVAKLNNSNCDIYHFGYSSIALGYLPIIRLLKGRKVISCRGTAENVKLVSEKQRLKNLAFLFAETDKIHCVSNAMKHVMQGYGAPQQKIFVNRPAIDTQFFTRSSVKKNDDIITILSVGRLVFQKGFLVGMLAVASLKERFGSFVWKIIGDGPEMEELTLHIHALGLSDNIEMLGKRTREEIKRCYEACDIYFLPSVSEGLANAVLEAMAMEVAVVSSDTGGMQEAVTNNYDGLLCKNYDTAAMSEALYKLCTNNELRNNLSANARKTAVERFDTKRYIDVFEEAYYGLMK